MCMYKLWMSHRFYGYISELINLVEKLKVEKVIINNQGYVRLE